MLRHSLATVSFRLGHVLAGAPPEFAGFRPGETVRTPAEILAHMGDLMDWALSLANDAQAWKESTPLAWDAEVARFHAALGKLDARIAAGPLACNEKQLLQGPIADALTHIGQLALLRRLHGEPVKRKNYFLAEI